MDLSGRHDIMPGSTMNSDVTAGEGARLRAIEGGAAVLFLAPDRGSMELWRLDTGDGSLQRLTADRHYLSAFDVRDRGSDGVDVVAICSTDVQTPDLNVGHVPAGGAGGARSNVTFEPVTSLNAELLAEIELRPAIERSVTVEGREIQGWLIPAGPGTAADRRRDPRRAAHPLRLGAVLGVPGHRRRRDVRLLLQPAWLGGLRPRVQRGQPRRLG